MIRRGRKLGHTESRPLKRVGAIAPCSITRYTGRTCSTATEIQLVLCRTERGKLGLGVAARRAPEVQQHARLLRSAGSCPGRIATRSADAATELSPRAAVRREFCRGCADVPLNPQSVRHLRLLNPVAHHPTNGGAFLAHGPRLVSGLAGGSAGSVQPIIRPGVAVGCTHPTPEAATILGP
jgi:hypothetical protein